MKKLPITKEAFEKSQYFTNKYGELEYVSESGKVFKTDKGKILMFKESKQVNEGLFSDIGSRMDDGIKGLKKMFKGKPKFKVGDELEWKYPNGDEWYPFVVKDVQWIDGQWRYGDENAGTYRPHGSWRKDEWHPQDWCRPKQDTTESTKKFTKEGTESNPRFKCMEGEDEYSDEIREFRDCVVSALKKCDGDEYTVEPDMMDYKSILVNDPYYGLDFKIDISVSTEVDM